MGLWKMIKNSSLLSENKIQKVIVENFDEIAPFYYKLLSEWTNSSYETFQDIDKYLIILYLINKDFDYYIQNELVESYSTFFLYDKSLELFNRTVGADSRFISNGAKSTVEELKGTVKSELSKAY